MTEPVARKWRLTLTVMTIVAAAAVMQIGIAAKGTAPPPSSWTPSLTKQQLVERGKYLVTIGGCNDCHTPWLVGPNGVPGPDPTRTLSGHPQDFPITESAQIGPGAASRRPVNPAPMPALQMNVVRSVIARVNGE